MLFLSVVNVTTVAYTLQVNFHRITYILLEISAHASSHFVEGVILIL